MPAKKSNERCCICGEKYSVHINGSPYCNKHYQSIIRYGTPYGHPRERTNTYEINGDVLIITTAKGKIILAYDTLEEAIQARIEAERKYHGEYGYHDSINKE